MSYSFLYSCIRVKGEHRLTQPPHIDEHPKGTAWHNLSAEEVLAQLGSNSRAFCRRSSARLAADGPERVEGRQRISALQIFFGQLKSLIIWILIGAGFVFDVLGEMVDAIAILAVVVLDAIIAVVAVSFGLPGQEPSQRDAGDVA